MCPRPRKKLPFPDRRGSICNLASLGHVVSANRSFENVDNEDNDNDDASLPCLFYKLIYEPKCSGELIIVKANQTALHMKWKSQMC